MNTLATIGITMVIVSLATVLVVLAKHAIGTRSTGRSIKPGKNAAVSSCPGCQIFGFTMTPAGISHLRHYMTEHYRENPEHGIPVEVIPEGWDR